MNPVSLKEKKHLLAGLFVAAIAFLIYANTLGNGFVWDDDPVILNNATLRGSALSLFSSIDIARSTEPLPYYRPLTLLSFLVEERLHGFSPFPVRLFNVLLHSANTFLVFQLARTLFARIQAPLLVALLFAVHPIQAEGVDFNSGGRNTLLACFFVLATYLLHKRSINNKRLREAFGGAILFMAGLLSKESAIALLPSIVFLELHSRRENSTDRIIKPAVRLVPYVITAVIYFVLRDHALSGAGVHVDYLQSIVVFFQNNLFIIPRYLLNVVWPGYLSAYYFIPDDPNLLALPLLISWCCIAGTIAWLLTRGRSHATLFGLVWAIAFWLPTSGIIPFNSAPLADRYMYISVIGLWIVAADQITKMLEMYDNPLRRLSTAVVAVVLVVLAITTVIRNRDWKDDIALFTGVVKLYPDQAWGHHNLGCAYLDKVKDLDLAEREFEKALALNPSFPRLRTQMGYVQLLRGDYNGAIRQYNEAIAQNPIDAEAFLNRGTAFDNLGRYEEAVADYKYFLAIPGNELPLARSNALTRIRELSR